MRALAIGFLAVIVVGAMAYVTMAQPGGGAPGPGVAPKGPGREPTKFTSPVMPKDDAEKKILDVLEEMNKNERGGMMNVPMEDGRILRMLAETTGAKQVVEIGTSNGFSGIWWCMALRKTGGKLMTFEIDATRAGLARKNFKRAGVDELVTLVEGDAHIEAPKLKDKNLAIDILFLDADKEGYIDYLEKLLPLVRPGGLIVAVEAFFSVFSEDQAKTNRRWYVTDPQKRAEERRKRADSVRLKLLKEAERQAARSPKSSESSRVLFSTGI